MNTLLLSALIVLIASANPISAQPEQKTRVNLDVRTEGRPDRDAATTRLLEDVRRGLQAIPDIELGSRDDSRRVIWIVTGATAGTYAASVIVTERYDRETLMVLGIEDDDMAHRMMALQIVIEHQIFTGRDQPEIAKRIVTALDTGVFARLRASAKKPQGR